MDNKEVKDDLNVKDEKNKSNIPHGQNASRSVPAIPEKNVVKEIQ